MNHKLMLVHMSKASGQRLTVREKRDLRWVAAWLFVAAALWAVVVLPWVL